MRALNGVGDASLGEWREAGSGGVFHIRRRMTPAEEQRGGGLVVRDIRGTPEENARLLIVFREMPQLRAMLGQRANA